MLGDIVKIRDGDEIPADLVVLSTSQKNGQCYVSTVNLDGYYYCRLKCRY